MSKSSQAKKIQRKAERRAKRKLPTANQPTAVEAQPLRREAEVASVDAEIAETEG